MDSARLDRIVAQVNALKPDVIVLTGDYSGGKAFGAYEGALSRALGVAAASARAPRGRRGARQSRRTAPYAPGVPRGGDAAC